MIAIVVGVLVVGSTSIGFIIRTRNRLLAKKELVRAPGTGETNTQKRSTLGDR